MLPVPFRFLNRAALQTESDRQADGSFARSWRLCTVEEVEDLKKLIRIIQYGPLAFC